MSEWIGSEQNDDLFGSYAYIEQGFAGEVHQYKIIGMFESNSYCDVPLTYITENNPHIHSKVVPVLNVIHMGVDESKVIRVALNDCKKISGRTVSKKPIEKPDAFDNLVTSCPHCGNAIYNYFNRRFYPPHCMMCGQKLKWEELGNGKS